MSPEEFARSELLEPISAYLFTAFLFFAIFVVTTAKSITSVDWIIVVFQFIVFFIGVSLKWFLLGGMLRSTVRVMVGVVVYSFLQVTVDVGVLCLLVFQIPKHILTHHLNSSLGISIFALSSLFLLDATFAVFMVYCLNLLRLLRRRIAAETDEELGTHRGTSDGIQIWAFTA